MARTHFSRIESLCPSCHFCHGGENGCVGIPIEERPWVEEIVSGQAINKVKEGSKRHDYVVALHKVLKCSKYLEGRKSRLKKDDPMYKMGLIVMEDGSVMYEGN